MRNSIFCDKATAARTDRSRPKRKPPWLKTELGGGGRYREVRKLLSKLNLHTVCSAAACPNLGECWKRGCLTIMILGDTCTRNCFFCNVSHQKHPAPPDPAEPGRVADALSRLKLKHTVITSVTRDDQVDGGSRHWARTIEEIHHRCPQLTLEALIPDFGGAIENLDRVLDVAPEILSHNLETVARLSSRIRPQADPHTSLTVLEHAARRGAITKSGLMVGLGETDTEILATMRQMRAVGVRIVTLGQYLQPTRKHVAVDRYVEPARFESYRRAAEEMGFDCVESGPLVRSSYRADRQAHLCQTNES